MSDSVTPWPPAHQTSCLKNPKNMMKRQETHGAVKTYWGSRSSQGRQCETHLPGSQVQKRPLTPFFMWGVHLLILKHWPEGQGLVGIPRTEAAGHPPSLPPFALLKLEGVTFPSWIKRYHLHPSTLLQSASISQGELLGSMISKPGADELAIKVGKKNNYIL